MYFFSRLLIYCGAEKSAEVGFGKSKFLCKELDLVHHREELNVQV